MTDHEVAEKIVGTYHFPDGVRKMRGKLTRKAEIQIITQDIELALTTAKQELAREMIAEGDRFVDAVKGRQDERADGAFVAMTRLVRNLRAVAKDNGVVIE